MIIAGFSLVFIGLIFVISYPINRKKNSRCSAETNGTLSEIRKRFDHDSDLKSMHVYSFRHETKALHIMGWVKVNDSSGSSVRVITTRSREA